MGEVPVKRKKWEPPEMYWTDPATGENMQRLTGREWMECVRLYKLGAKYGLYRPQKKKGEADARN